MTITVRHFPTSLFKEFSFCLEDKNVIELAQETLKHNQYIRVADIDSSKSAVESINIWLEEGYRKTNSIDKAWYDLEFSEVGPCRSTSIGDIIQIQGQSYVVLSSGFKLINKQ